METLESGILQQPEVLSLSPEDIQERFNDIVTRVDETVAQNPELREELGASPLQKNTGMSDKPQAWR